MQKSSESLPAFSRDWAMFLDVDGTLVELADRPENVDVNPDLPPLIASLTDALDNALALVSGRELGVLDKLLGMPQLAAAGLHGVEWRMPGESDRVRVRSVDEGVLDHIRRKLYTLTERYPALWIEDKRLSLALHYRQAPQLQATAEALVREALDEVHADHGEAGHGERAFQFMRGHMIAEVRSRNANKGYALEEFMRHAPFKGRVPVFIGDDVTDEDGFEAVNQRGGISVKVGEGATRARFRLGRPAEVLSWLGEYRDFLYSISQ